MKVQLIEATDNPDKLVCLSARNDYLDKYVGEMSFEEIMNPGADETVEDKQRELITHLMQHGHFGPFEHSQATFSVKGMSRSCMAQLTRHRHVSFDVQSMRYVDFSNMDSGNMFVEVPELEDAGTPGRNADISGQFEHYSDEELLMIRREEYYRSLKRSLDDYKRMLQLGLAPENARMVLPIGTKVNVVFSLNARMLMHVADMRAAADAQFEIRGLTNQVIDLAEEWAPITFELYNEILKGRKNRLAP